MVSIDLEVLVNFKAQDKGNKDLVNNPDGSQEKPTGKGTTPTKTEGGSIIQSVTNLNKDINGAGASINNFEKVVEDATRKIKQSSEQLAKKSVSASGVTSNNKTLRPEQLLSEARKNVQASSIFTSPKPTPSIFSNQNTKIDQDLNSKNRLVAIQQQQQEQNRKTANAFAKKQLTYQEKVDQADKEALGKAKQNLQNIAQTNVSTDKSKSINSLSSKILAQQDEYLKLQQSGFENRLKARQSELMSLPRSRGIFKEDSSINQTIKTVTKAPPISLYSASGDSTFKSSFGASPEDRSRGLVKFGTVAEDVKAIKSSINTSTRMVPEERFRGVVKLGAQADKPEINEPVNQVSTNRSMLQRFRDFDSRMTSQIKEGYAGSKERLGSFFGGGSGGSGGDGPPKPPSIDNGPLKQFSSELATTAKTMLKFTVAGTALGAVFGSFAQGAKTIAEVNAQMTELNRVLATNKSTLDQLKTSAISTAVEYGQSVQEVLKGYNIFAQQGLSASEIQQRSKTVSLGANVSTLGQQDLSETMTAFLKAYPELEKAPIRLIDSFAAVEDANAVVAKDLADAGKKVAVAANNAGISFDQLNAITTVIQEATRAGGAQIGTAERRIFLNLNTPKTEGVLKEVGINTKDESGNFKNSFDILQQIADIYPTLTDAKRRDIAQTIAETRFTNQFLALMNNFSKVNKVVAQSQNSSGYATEKNAIQMSSLYKQVGSTSAAFQGLALSVSDGITTPITDALKVTTSLVQALTSLSNVKIPGLGGLTSIADSITGAGVTEKGSQGINLGSATALVVEGALLGTAVKLIASSLGGLVSSIVNAGKAFSVFTGLSTAVAGITAYFGIGTGYLATFAAGFVPVLAALAAGATIFYGFNRALETAQDRLTRTGVTGEKSRSSASLAKFTELGGEFNNLQSRKTALDREASPSKSALSALDSLQKRNIESIRSAIVQIPESSLKNIKDLKIDNLNNVSFKGQSLEDFSKSNPEGLKDLIKTLMDLEKQAFKTSTSISEATKVSKGQVSFIGRMLGYKPSGAQEVSSILGGNVNIEENRAAREGIRDPIKRFEKVTENIGNTFENFRKSSGPEAAKKDFDIFVKQLGTTGQADLIKQISLISNPDVNSQTIREISKRQGIRNGFQGNLNSDSGKSDLFNAFQSQMQLAQLEVRKSSLIKTGQINETTGIITGDKVSPGNTEDLKNKILSETGKGSSIIQTLSKTGEVLEQFTVDVSESGKLVLKSASTNPADVFKGVTFTSGIDAIVEKLKKAGDILIAGSEVFANEVDEGVQTVLGGFGAGKAVEVPKGLSEGAKSLKDYSDSSAAAFKTGENGIVNFNERLQQFVNSLAERQATKSEGLTSDDRLKQQQISVVSSVINSLGRANKAIDSLSSNLESIDIKNKLDEMFSPSAIDSSRAFGGRSLAVTLGKSFKELSAPEQATDRFSKIFGKVEELQTFKSQLKSAALELDTIKLSLNNVLKSTDTNILKTINVDALSNLISSNQPGLGTGELEAVMSDLQKNILQGGNSKEDQDKIVNKLLNLIPDSSMFQEQVDSINKELKPLEEAAKSAIALQQLTISAQQAADNFKLQQKTAGFFNNLKEGVGSGLNAIAGQNSPIIFSEDATGRRQQRGLNGVTNLDLQKELNRVLSSSDVQSGVIKIFDESGKRLEAISQDEARTRNQGLDIQATRERKSLKEETRNARVNEFTSSLTSQYGAIDQLLNQGGLNSKAVSGLKAIQTSIEQEAKKPASMFLGPRGDLLQSSTSLLTRLPNLLSSVFNKDDLKGILKGAPDEVLKTLSNSGSQEAKDLLLERKAENLEPLVTPATKIEQNTTTMLGYFNTLIGFAQGIFGKLGVNKNSDQSNNKIKEISNSIGSSVSSYMNDNIVKPLVKSDFVKSAADVINKNKVAAETETSKFISESINLPDYLKNKQEGELNYLRPPKDNIIRNLEDAKQYNKGLTESRSPVITNFEDAKQYNTDSKNSKTDVISGLSSVATSNLSKTIAEAILPNEINNSDLLAGAGFGLGAGAIGFQGYKLQDEYSKYLNSPNVTVANKIRNEGGMASAIAKTQGKIPFPTFQANIPDYLKTLSSVEPVITNPLSYASPSSSSLSSANEYAKYRRPLEHLLNPSAVPTTVEALTAPVNVTSRLPGGLTSVENLVQSSPKPIGMLSRGLGFAGKALNTLGLVDAPVDAFNSASAGITNVVAPLFNNDTFRSLSNSMLGTNVPSPKSEADRFALQIASNQTSTDALKSQLTSNTPTSLLLESLGMPSARDSGLFNSLFGGQEYVSGLDEVNKEDKISLNAMYSNERSMNNVKDLSKIMSTDSTLSGSDRTGKELKNINENIQTQTKQTQTGLEVTNVSDISTAVKDGVERASSSFSDSFKESVSDLKSSFSSLIEALNSNKTNSTTGGQLNDIEARIQALLAPAIDAVVEQANVIRVSSEQKLGELSDVINGVENNTKDKIELIRSELDAKITSGINAIDSKTNSVSQELNLVKSSIESTSNDSKIALSLAGLAQQKADQVETQVNSVQARVTQAALNFNGY
jgi:TP901 family phage tail tape measure protein